MNRKAVLRLWLAGFFILLPLAPAADARSGEPDEARLAAKIETLIKQLGHDEWGVREAASAELAKIGKPAVPALEKAAQSPDAETAARAAKTLAAIRALRPSRVDPNGTDGYQLVYGNVRQVQTFKAGAEKLDAVRFRAARTHDMPADDLLVELREPGKEEPLARGVLYTDSPTRGALPEGAKPSNVSRFYRWMNVELKAGKLEKGKTYELAFSSPKSLKAAPWIINCFYRDTYPDGEHSQVEDGKASQPGKFDLVFEAVTGEARVSSVPKDADLSRKDEHFGLGHDGSDLKRPDSEVDERGAFF